MNKTKNIKLRKINRSDLQYFLKWWRDKELIALTSGIYIESEKILKSMFDKMLEKSDGNFIVIYNTKAIGHISLTKKGPATFELHIVIGEKKYLGRGLGTLAIKKSLDIGFNKLGYKKACLEVRPDNDRAIRAYVKCGFVDRGLKKYKNNKYQPVARKMELKKRPALELGDK
jgi:RimJ/RimL family protein N-acetyltransferase